jgi:hypothetical protein
MRKLLLAAALVAAVALAACGTPATQPSRPPVSDPPAPSVPAEPSTPQPTVVPPSPTPTPVITPAPTARPTPRPTAKPTPVAFSRAERYLIDGIMRGESDCSPVRGDRLPDRALAGIDCEVVGTAVARIGYYLFRNDADMLDAYLARVRAEGLQLESGPSCLEGEAEHSYIPTGDDPGISPSRTACFVNDEGFGNYRLTLPAFHVYVGMLGRTADMAKLDAFAWFGNQDTPGTPTLWQQSFVYRP